MKSDVTTVEAYLDEVSAVRRPALHEVRRLARELLTDHEERMQYGMASYARNETVDFAFASQSKYISLYVMKRTSSLPTPSNSPGWTSARAAFASDLRSR